MRRSLSSERDEIEEGLTERDAEHREAASEVAKDIARAFGADPGAERPDHYDERTNWDDWLDSQLGAWLTMDDYYGAGLDVEEQPVPIFGYDDVDW
jgi:hypothetical protein